MRADAQAHTAFATGYRADIDGLRALAVIAVIFFHAHFWPFSGGFVGVDVFFVISGFLITSIIKKELDRNDFSISKFYERRIRRIFPALFFLLLGVTPLALFVLLPVDTVRFGQSLLATALFAANVYFWRNAGYFAPDADSYPLLHTWSLAVEEQFYIVFPLFLLILLKLRNHRFTMLGLGLATLASLLVAEWHLDRQSEAVFYLLPTRAWELLFGAALALGRLPTPSRAMANAAGGVGLAMIGIVVVLYSRFMPFPGVAAVPPCLGTVLVLYSGQRTDGAVGRALSYGPLRFVGKISYSLYLWHFPPLVLARIYLDRDLTALESWALIGAATAMSAFSWRFIEAPFRRTGKADVRWRVIGLGATASLAFCALGIALFASGGVPGRFAPEVVRVDASQVVAEYPPSCIGPNAGASPSPCGGTRFEVLVWGDSHAAHYFAGIEQRAAATGIAAQLQWVGGCPPVLGAVPVRVPVVRNETIGPPARRDPGCPALNAKVLEAIRTNPTIGAVALAGAWDFWGEGLDLATGEQRYLSAPGSADFSVEESRRVLREGLGRTITELRNLGLYVLLLGQVPDNPQSPSRCMARAYVAGTSTEDCGRRREDALRRAAWSRETLAELAAEHGAAVFDPATLLCGVTRCSVQADGEALYRDPDHLTPAGSMLVASGISAEFFDAARLRVSAGGNSSGSKPYSLPRP